MKIIKKWEPIFTLNYRKYYPFIEQRLEKGNSGLIRFVQKNKNGKDTVELNQDKINDLIDFANNNHKVVK